MDNNPTHTQPSNKENNMRIDTEGRDVTDLAGLWDDRDSLIVTTKTSENPLTYGVGIFSESCEVMGAAIAIFREYPMYNIWEIDKIKIEEPYRGMGYGSRLLDATVQELWKIKQVPIVVHPGLPGFLQDSNEEILINMQKFGVAYLDAAIGAVIDWYGRHSFVAGSSGNPKASMWRVP